MLKVRTVKDAYEVLNHPIVKDWFNKIEQFKTPQREVLLLVPCASAKPYTPGATRSLFYRWLWSFLSRYKLRDIVFVATISEPLAVVPENMYFQMPIYDFPPTILKKDSKLMKIYTKILGKLIGIFLSRNISNHEKILAYVRPDSTHWQFINYAKQIFRIDVKFVVNENDFRLIRKKHKRTWQLNWMVYLSDKLLKALTK